MSLVARIGSVFRSVAGLLIASVLAATLACAPPASAGGVRRGRSYRTRAISLRDSARVHLLSSNGASRVVSGQATGTIKGTLRFSATVTADSFTYSFTLYASGGTISGSGRGKLHIGNHGYASFAGSGTVSSGSGRYRHVTGSGNFYGAENRRTHDGTVQIIARIRY